VTAFVVPAGPRAWALSVALHAALLSALMLALGRGHHEPAPESPARLVWVEPAPPAAPPVGSVLATGANAGTTLPAPQPVAEEPRPAPPVRDRIEQPSRRSLVPRERRAAAERPPHPTAAAIPPETAAVGPGTADGVAGAHGDTAGGTRGGVTGGTLGGIGTAPLALRDVATPPELVDRVLPEYPPRARAREIEGQVVLEVVLDRSGRIEDAIRVVRSIPLLDEAAVAAVKQWRFRPARDHDGRPVPVVMEVPVRFVLR
jgi:protein TonB